MNYRWWLYKTLTFINEVGPLHHFIFPPSLDVHWKPYFSRPDFQERERAVSAGLDEESLKIVRQVYSLHHLHEVLPYPHDVFWTSSLWPEPFARRRRWFAIDPALVARFQFISERIVAIAGENHAAPMFTEWKSKASTLGCLNGFPFDAAKRLEGKAFVDGGAWIGDTALLYAAATPASVVYAFEPFPSTFTMLKKVVAEESRIVPVVQGLGAKTQEVKIAGDSDCANGETLLGQDGKDGGAKISVTTLDDFFRDKKVPCGCIKLDVEGLESDTIDGALETIRRDRPLLLISVYHTARDFYEIKPKLEALNVGYHFRIRPGNDRSCCTEFMLLGWTD